MEYRINHNQTEIIFTVEFRNRRSTAIQVHPDQSVRVLAPKLSSKRAIIRSVAERAPWIIKKQVEFAGMQQKYRKQEFVTGEKLVFLGKQYRLKTAEGPGRVELKDSQIILTVPAEAGVNERKKLLQNWYRRQSEVVFTERFEKCLQAAAAIGIKSRPEWKSRVMKRSWGSCTAGKRINLNLELVSTPPECIDYVIIHELCHLKEANHSGRFYSLLEKACPDWKQRKKLLNENYRTIFV